MLPWVELFVHKQFHVAAFLYCMKHEFRHVYTKDSLVDDDFVMD
jgi:hypothetical protein